MNALLLLPLLALGLQSQAVELNVDAKNGDILSGERSFRVTAVSKDPVIQVEFYVGEDLRDSDTSTPYEFRLDTLSEDDGPIKVGFKAYTSEGGGGQKILNLTIDNGLSKGAAFHVERGLELLTESNWKGAIDAGRTALKIDPKSNPARVVLSRANIGLNALDPAQRYAEDAIAQDPRDRAALNILGFIGLRRAYGTVARGDANAADTRKAIETSLLGGIGARRRATEVSIDEVGDLTDTNALAYADAAIAGRRYSAVAIALGPIFDKDNRQTAIGNRLAFAQMREGLFPEAYATLTKLGKNEALDAYGQTLLSVVSAELGDAAKSDEAMKSAILGDAGAPYVQAAQAYLALKFNRIVGERGVAFGLNYDRATNTPERAAARQLFLRQATELTKSEGKSPEVDYYLGALYNRLEDSARGQAAFQRATLTEPLLYDAYIEQANRSLLIATTSKVEDAQKEAMYESATTMFRAALTARDDSAEALTGLSLVAGLRNDTAESLKWATAAVGANPKYAAAQLALAVASRSAAKAQRREADRLRSSGQEAKARETEASAVRYDASAREALAKVAPLEPFVGGQEFDTAAAAWRYYNVGGRRAVIPAPRG